MIQQQIHIQKDSPLPLYYQLKEIIRNQVINGLLMPGEMISSEKELVQQFNISRPTVRQAINELVAEGLLTRIKGKGTFVAKRQLSQWSLESMTSFADDMSKKGVPHSTKVLQIDVVDSESMLYSTFHLEQAKYFRVERLRFINMQPIAIVTTYVPCFMAPELEQDQLEQNSLYDLIRHKYKRKISHATRELIASHASVEDAHQLGLEPMSAIQLVKTIGYLDRDKAFEYTIARYRGDASSFLVKVKYTANNDDFI